MSEVSVDIKERVKKRLTDYSDNANLIDELIATVEDRLCIRLDEETLPKKFTSICVDAVVKAYRRVYFEGITAEGVENLSTSFVEDILAEYAFEISAWIEKKANLSGSGKIVRFL